MVDGGLPELREVIRASSELRRYEPRGDASAVWTTLEARIAP